MERSGKFPASSSLEYVEKLKHSCDSCVILVYGHIVGHHSRWLFLDLAGEVGLSGWVESLGTISQQGARTMVQLLD